MSSQPTWIIINDTIEKDRKLYFNPREKSVQWEPTPTLDENETIEEFNESKHAIWRIMANVVSLAYITCIFVLCVFHIYISYKEYTLLFHSRLE